MKKFPKWILPMLVAIAMSGSSSAVAFAAEASNDAVTYASEYDTPLSSNDSGLSRAGAETWSYTGYYVKSVGSFSMTGSNMTPTKTIPSEARCHYLTIYADYNCSSSSKLKVEIVNASTGAVLARSTSGAGTSGHVNVRAGNVSGKKVKIRFIVQDSNGNYAPSRSCNVSYSYNLCALSE